MMKNFALIILTLLISADSALASFQPDEREDSSLRGRQISEPTLPQYTTHDDVSTLYRYTASEGQLKIRLGEDYVPILDPNSPAVALRANVENELALSKELELKAIRLYPEVHGKSPTDVERLEAAQADPFLVEQLTQTLLKERSFDPRWMVLYRAVSGESGLVYDILTALHHLLSSSYSENHYVFRIGDKLNGIDTVLEYEGILASQQGEKRNLPPLFTEIFSFSVAQTLEAPLR